MTSASEPYPGLRPFRKDEHAFFFGRYEHIAALYRLLDRGRLLAILGGSGSGKSSLILAGLLPLLEAEKRSDSTPRWTIVSLRPGAHPIRRLAAALLTAAASEAESIQRTIAGLRHTSAGLGTEINRLLPGDNDVLILVDQFEELFRFADAGDTDGREGHAVAVARLSRDDESRRFIELLLTATTFSARRIRIVITMRSDFLGDCARYRGLAEAVSGNQYLAPWLDRDQQREAIVGPLLRGAGRLDDDVFELTDTPVNAWSDLIEPQLVEQLLNDAGDEPDQLPVMQHALRRCWREADGERMTLHNYRELGGWGVILSNHADNVMQRCGSERAAAVERMFRALIECDGTGRATRRPCTIAQLSKETGSPEADIRAIVAEFSSTDCSFLAPPTPPPDELVDIGHEALIRQWRKIAHPARGWLQEEARDGMLWQLLVFQAQTHAQNAEEVLSAAVTEQRLPWFKQRNEHWASRYGDQWPLVAKLMSASNRARIMARRKKSALKAVAVACLVVLLMMLVVTQVGHREQAEAQAVAIGLQLEFPDGTVKEGDKKALLELAKDTDDDARLAFITQVSKSPELAGRLARNASMVTRALVGVDPDKREQVIDYVFGPKANVPQDGTTLYARALFGAELAAPQAGEIILEALRSSTNPQALRRLAQGIAALPHQLTEKYAEAAVEPFVVAIQSSSAASDFKILAEGLALLPVEKLSAAQAKTVVDAFSEATRDTANPDDLALLGYGIAALAPQLPQAEAERALQSTGTAMQLCENSVGLKGLSQGLAKLYVESEPAAMSPATAVTPFLTTMRETRDMRTLKRFTQGLAALPAGLELSAAEAQQLPQLLRDTLPMPPRSSDLKYFAEALATLPIDLTAEQAAFALNPILAAMAETTDPYPLKRLAEGAAALAAYLTEAQAAQTVTHVVDTLEDKGKDFYGLEPLGAGLAALTAKLNKAQAEQAIEPILAVIEETPDPHAIGLLAIGLAKLDIDFSEVQTERALQPMFAAMQPAVDANVLRLLHEGLAALAPRLNAAQSKQAVQPVLAAMWETSDSVTLARLAAGLTALSSHLDGAQAVQPLLDAVKMPWTAGVPSEVLVQAIWDRLQRVDGDAEEQSSVNLWEVSAQAKRQFGSEIDLTRPPDKPV